MCALRYIRGACKCCCKNGSVIPKWQNISKVRPPGDSGGIHYTSDPFSRYDAAQYDGVHASPQCSAIPHGSCGIWLQVGDLNGTSTQAIDDTVDDIMACASPDSTHAKSDHNCYLKNGTIDMRMSKVQGGQWIHGNKFWHGTFGFTSPELCDSTNPNLTASQEKYLTATYSASYSEVTKLPPVANDGSGQPSNETTVSGSRTVDRFTGLISNSVSVHEIKKYRYQVGCDSGGNNIYNKITVEDHTNGIGTSSALYADFTGFTGCPFLAPQNTITNPTIIDPDILGDIQAQPFCLNDIPTIDNIINSWNSRNPAQYPPVSKGSSTSGFSLSATSTLADSDGNHYSIAITVSRTSTAYVWSASMYFNYIAGTGNTLNYSGSITLSNPYTAADFYNDCLAGLDSWDMSDFNLASLRQDEQLGNAPCAMYDEVQTTITPFSNLIRMDDYAVGLTNDKNNNAPGSTALTNNDLNGAPPGSTNPPYAGGQPYIPTWCQTDWVDSNGYIWKAPAGQRFGTVSGYTLPDGSTSGAMMITGIRDGSIISHSITGADNHFWFGSLNYKRGVRGGISPCAAYEWYLDSYGSYCDPFLPPVTMRWLPKSVVQYDPLASCLANPPKGVWPQSFVHEENGKMLAAKFMQATQRWPSVNYGRPCGPDKYAIDQTTVGFVTGSGAGTFTVVKSGSTTTSFPSTGYVAVKGYGIYSVSSVTGAGPWTIHVGSLIDTLPTGGIVFGDARDSTDWIGWLRWPTASGICGRAQITTSYSAGTLTISVLFGLPYLRAITGAITVDLYDSSMTLLTSGANLTRVSDSSFTMASAGPSTAAYMTGNGVDWTKYDSTSKGTGVKIEWTFNPRSAAAGYSGTTYNYAGINGCVNGSISQFNFTLGKCPAMVGIVPFNGDAPAGDSAPTGDYSFSSSSPIESGVNQVMFPMPDLFSCDDGFSAHWQGAIELTMVDPFWQPPFKPDQGIVAPDAMTWNEDDGTGQADYTESAGGGILHHCFYAHRPLVEASSTIPAGCSLPAGIDLFYDPANQISPPYYPSGIPVGDSSGNFASIEMPWGFAKAACATIVANGRFKDDYLKFVNC